MRHCGVIRVDPKTKHEALAIAEDFPYCANSYVPHDLPARTFPWHWHTEIEVFFIREGQLDYNLLCGRHSFYAGQGGFINSNVLHQTVCPTATYTRQEEQQFMPELIGGFNGSRIMRKYVRPVLDTPGLNIIKFDPVVPQHIFLLEKLCAAYHLFEKGGDCSELAILEQLCAFWEALYLLTEPQRNCDHTGADDHRIKQMLAFIAAHYAEQLTLNDIAQAAYMSPRTCGRYFKEQLGVTPFSYLIGFRVKKACELLAFTNIPVGDVALNCGFCGGSYFSSLFCRETGQTPNAYRKAHQERRLAMP